MASAKSNFMGKKLFFVTSLFFILLVSLCQAADTVKEVSFVIDPWPPWSYGEEGKTPEKGIIIEIIQEIFTRLDDFEPKFTLYPWKRCLYYVENGGYHSS
jgi:ABC-type amino acid transport substrate-binding protein